MAKRDEPKERLLRKLIEPAYIAFDGSTSFTVTGSGWDIITAEDSAGNPAYWAVWRGYFDLSGLVADQETLFTIGPTFQEGCDWNFVSTLLTGALQVWDMVTQEYLTNNTFNGAVPISGNWIPPGMIGRGQLAQRGAYELQDVHYGNARSFQNTPMATGGVSPYLPSQTRSTGWGTGSATAGQKLYITRAIHISSALAAAPNNEIRSPASAVVIPSLIARETDLRYIERLRRSYVVQGES
ncbi:MAG TPA: hypothetical protein EYN66_22230 [Myxococcales bacterium]|nr:hypothetical protein [Myxococcales bacterium]